MFVRVAVIDDDESVLDAIQMALAYEGWDIYTYSTGEAFLEDLIDHRPDCIILDPHLSGMSGAELALSMTNASSNIPMIGLTVRPNSIMTTKAINAGVRVMLTKPVTAEELADQVKTAIHASGPRKVTTNNNLGRAV